MAWPTMTPDLRVVSAGELPAPPYDRNIRSRGWSFDLDLERVKQSDTWAIASLDMRPWLLMLWATSWEQTPCGSLPKQDELIAARIGMDPRTFRANRDILMRGWVLHSDGKYYHSHVTQLVQKMLMLRRKDAERQAVYKQSLAEKVTRDSRVSHALLQSESDTHPHPHPYLKAKAKKKINKESRGGRASVSACLPDGWTPSGVCVSAAMERYGMSEEQVARQTEAFADYCAAHGKRYKDHDAAWRNSVRADWFGVLNGGRGNGKRGAVDSGGGRGNRAAADRAADECLGRFFDDAGRNPRGS